MKVLNLSGRLDNGCFGSKNNDKIVLKKSVRFVFLHTFAAEETK